MIRGRCPICSREFAIQALDDLPSFPFCSDRCRLIDLGRWIDGAYTVPSGKTTSEDDEDDGETSSTADPDLLDEE